MPILVHADACTPRSLVSKHVLFLRSRRLHSNVDLHKDQDRREAPSQIIEGLGTDRPEASEQLYSERMRPG